ncbi:hypothetical protein GGR56DRAFT_680300 [Xylariaceae sp. FL0804]|nr:hypothetical protein GGR56DRAFT_680300 [Xylariaceae sp. FL0804]
MAPPAARSPLDRRSNQPGSKAIFWDRDELKGTGCDKKPNLQGEVHPVFATWAQTDPDLRGELEQPLLLASRLLESSGLLWLSDFVVDDVFDELYPGRAQKGGSQKSSEEEGRRAAPEIIVRHHRAPWATPELRRQWLDVTRSLLKGELAESIRWELDGKMFQEKGWVGYTCRHPRGQLPLEELDRYETIERSDREGPRDSPRKMTILVAEEYPRRLGELRHQGGAGTEEYLLTAFMAAVTILHELGHAAYWRDRRHLTRALREPFYGSDLEMELGDSFVAHAFGGWIPVSVRGPARLREESFSLADGLAWRQALDWDHHRMRPKHRAHYSIPVDYADDAERLLVQPLALVEGEALRSVGLQRHLADPDPDPELDSTRGDGRRARDAHAVAALPDFHRAGDGYAWDRRPGARFRIPQYDGPTATDDVVREPVPRRPHHAAAAAAAVEEQPKGQSQSQSQSSSPRRFLLSTPPTKIPQPVVAAEKKKNGSGSPASPTRRHAGTKRAKPRTPTKSARKELGQKGGTITQQPPVTSPATNGTTTTGTMAAGKDEVVVVEEEEVDEGSSDDRCGEEEEEEDDDDIPRVRLAHNNNKSGGGGLLSPDRPEISVDELKKRLSRLIGVSLTELEKLFETPQCG